MNQLVQVVPTSLCSNAPKPPRAKPAKPAPEPDPGPSIIDNVIDRVVDTAPDIVLATFVPFYGEYLDIAVIVSSDYAWWQRGLAGVSLVSSVFSGGLGTNYGAIVARGTAERTVREGIYEFAEDGATYVGQSSNISARLARYVADGRLADPSDAIVGEVLGGKVAREIAEYRRIQAITGGVPARLSDRVTNMRDPLGTRRKSLR